MTFKQRAIVYLAVALVLATLLSLFAGVLSLASRGAQLHRLGLGYLQLVSVYYGGALVGSLVLSLASPLSRWLIGAGALGALTLFPLYLGFSLLMYPRGHWYPDALIVGVIACVVVGVPLGLYAWSLDHPGKARAA